MLTAFTAASAVVPSLLLLWFFHTRDRFPEPRRVIWMTFFLGALSAIGVAIVAAPLYLALQTVNNAWLQGLGVGFLAAAVPEEFFKYLVLRRYCTRNKAFDEPMDGLVYGVAASLGFATLENVLYVAKGGLVVALARAFTAVPTHAMLGAIMGYYVGQAHFRPAHRGSLLFRAWFIPMLCHGIYDFPMITLHAEHAQHHSIPSPGLVILLVAITLGTLVVLWVWAVRLARKLRALQDAGTSTAEPADLS